MLHRFGITTHNLAMLRSRKQIHGLHLLSAIPMLSEPRGIAGGGGGVAADVDHPAGGHLDDGGKGRLIAALAGRVEHNDVRPQALGGEAGSGLAGIGTEEAALGGDGIAHPGGIGFGTVDGLGNDLHADQLTAVAGHREADGAHAAVEIEQDIVRLKLGVFGSDAVEALGSQRVDLIEGEGAEADGHAAEGVLDAARAIEGHAPLAEDDVGLFGVDIDEDGGNIAELFPEQSYQLIAVGELRAGADEADHDLAAVCAPAQEDVPHEALAALFVIGLDAVGSEEGAEGVADVVQDAGLQLAVGAGDDAVGAPGVKTDAGCAVLIAAHRELDFVAVAVYLRGGEGVQHRHIQPADAAEGVGDALLLGTQFGSIIQMPQAAAAAGAGYRAVHRDAVRRGGEQLVQNAEGVPAAVLDDAHLRLVTGGSARDKDGLALRRVGHAAAVVGKALDAQGEKLIFL